MPDPHLTVLDQLDQWRHLPKYRLEQHVDVLFGLTLPTVLSARTGIPEDDLQVIPEFPIAYHLLPMSLRKGAKDNQSFNVDFAVWSKQSGRVFLVELKTDVASLDKAQLMKMAAVSKCHSGKNIMDAVRKIANASSEARKYAHLIWRLHEAGAMYVPCDFKNLKMEDQKPGLTGKSGAFSKSRANPTFADAEPELFLVTPSKSQEKLEIPRCFTCIDFEEYARTIDGRGGLENALAHYLLRWRTKAGSANPWQRNAPPPAKDPY